MSPTRTRFRIPGSVSKDMEGPVFGKSKFVHPLLLQLVGRLTLFCLINASASVLHVDLNSTNSIPPYTNWATAAVTIQDAVDAANPGDQLLVSNGVYQTGQRVLNGCSTNRVVVDKAVKVQSVNGPAATLIDGFSAMRCVYMTNDAALEGFTLRNGLAPLLLTSTNAMSFQGGGVYCTAASVSVSNCVFMSNSAGVGGGVHGGTLHNCTLASNSAGLQGGAADSGIMNNCTLTGNLSDNYGGGASYCALKNCTLIGNHAFQGGGALHCTLNNCTLAGNSAGIAGGGAASSILNNCIVFFNTGPQANYSASTCTYCCTTPLPVGTNNIETSPLFVDLSSGDLRLQSNSPCVNAGDNLYAPLGLDLGGNPRISGGMVDIGAYEYQNPSSTISYAWLQQYGLPANGSADFSDSDADGMNNWQEWIAGTNPTNGLSTLKILSLSKSFSVVTVNWQSVNGKAYCLQRGSNLLEPAFLSIQTNILGQAGITSSIDTNANGAGPYFYRVGVQQ